MKKTPIHAFGSRRESVQIEVKGRRTSRTSSDLIGRLGFILYILGETRRGFKAREVRNLSHVLPHSFQLLQGGGQEEMEQSS